MDHLQLVNGEYRVRVVVPATLRPVIGKANLTKVLRTADPAKARELAAPVIAKFKARLSRAASAKPRRRRSDDAEWYTPKAVFDAMGVEFDLDVCSPGASAVDWIPAKRHLTKAEDGLARPWSGFVWCNPPHGLRNGMQKWIDNFVEHGNGVIILPGMTFTKWFHDFAPKAECILFPLFKLRFIQQTPGRNTTLGDFLAAIGENGVMALQNAANKGFGTLFQAY